MTTRAVPVGQLQSIINSSVAGDVLELAAGTHTGLISCPKKLVIDGKGAATIHGVGAVTFKASAQGITIRNVKITGATGAYSALILQEAAATDLTVDNVVLEGTRVSDPNAITTVFGIRHYRSSRLFVKGGEMSRLSTGIEFNRAGAGSVIDGLWVHDLDRMQVNDTAAGTDAGGMAFAFYNALGPITVRNCKIERCRAPSYDYGMDGAAFEFYGSGTGGVVIEDCETVDCIVVAETGKSSTDTDYDNVIFRRNLFRSTNTAQVSDSKQASNGFYMRSAKNWKFEDNEFRDLDWWCFAFDYGSTQYSGQLSNISAVRNTVYLKPGVNRWLSFDDAVPLTVFTSDGSKVYQPAGSGNVIAERQGGPKTNVLATWRAAAPGHETGASVWTTPPVTPPPTTTDPDAARIAELEAQVASLTSSLAQSNTALASANAATNAAQQQRDAYLAKLNALRAAVTSNVADLVAANTAAQP